ncbi:hypothetical protein [Marinobacterium litorale]|uniref:hypothetical protein n=1 Tax=Marinobacterium litorale TaxID=404770 RepID=UPI0003FF0D79|nr:hypothetical protein [Marinobacterium litorale]
MALIHYWPFNEASGSEAVDVIGGWVATVAGDSAGESIADGVMGRGRDLAATATTYSPAGAGYIQMAGESGLLAEWSICVLVDYPMPGSVPLGYSVTLFSMGDWVNTPSTFDCCIYDDGSGLYVDIYDENGDYGHFLEYNPGVQGELFGGPLLVVIACDGTATRLDVNGVTRATAAAGYSIDPSASFALGSYAGGTSSYSQAVHDDLAIFDHAISESDSATLWNSGTGLPAIALEPNTARTLSQPLGEPSGFVVEGQGPALGIPSAKMFADWAAILDPFTTKPYYACDIIAGDTTIRVPISSWQATIQDGRASYVQAVIPAASGVADSILALTDPEFVIWKGVLYQSGKTNETELARAPIQTPQISEGPTNYTLTISGYTQFEVPDDTGARVLQNVRSQSMSPDIRVRCDIDWFLRPGQTAISRGTPFTVAYINYYANGKDQYMDVGERSL